MPSQEIHKVRRELRAFQRSEVTLSFELERVLDRNIGIGSPGSGAVPMRILRGVSGIRSSADEDFEGSLRRRKEKL